MLSIKTDYSESTFDHTPKFIVFINFLKSCISHFNTASYESNPYSWK